MRQSFKRLLIAGMLGCWITASLVGCSSEHHDSFSGEVISDVVIPDGSAETEWDTASRGEKMCIRDRYRVKALRFLVENLNMQICVPVDFRNHII